MIEVTGAAASASDRRWLAEQLAAALPLLGGTFAEIRIRAVDDREMILLHQRSMGVPTTTDVLAWTCRRPDGVEADIAICVDEARRRAAEAGHAEREEMLLYAVHGLLHGLGYGDGDPESFRRMHDMERRIMQALGASAWVDPEEPTRSDGGGRA